MTMLSRRQWLKTAGTAIGATLMTGPLQLSAFGQAAAQNPAGPFTLPRLPYANDALVRAVDARTMEIHHDRHHQAYVNGLNTAVANHAELGRRPIADILRNITTVPEAIRTAVTNNGGGHYNHSMFWEIMTPTQNTAPAGALLEAINTTFTSVDNFKMQFKQACLARFGSGWGWLVYSNNRLSITSTANQDCPLMTGAFPVFGLDVWEHAYYLHYQNRRADYIDAWWTVANWPVIGERFNQARA